MPRLSLLAHLQPKQLQTLPLWTRRAQVHPDDCSGTSDFQITPPDLALARFGDSALCRRGPVTLCKSASRIKSAQKWLASPLQNPPTSAKITPKMRVLSHISLFLTDLKDIPCVSRCLHIVTILIFIASSGPSVQGELRTKGLCRSEVPLPSSHLPSNCAILWGCVSADTGSSGGISQSPREGEKKKSLFYGFGFTPGTTYFRLCNLDFLILLLWLGGVWSLLMGQRLLWHRRTSSQAKKKKKKERKVLADTSTELSCSCAFSLHCSDRVCPSIGQLQIGSFSRGGRWRQCRCACLLSAVRMSLSAALK